MLEGSKFHYMRDGSRMLITDMKDDHINSTIEYIKRKAKTGILVNYSGDFHDNDFGYSFFEIKGKRAKELMNYEAYKAERKRRQKLDSEIPRMSMELDHA